MSKYIRIQEYLVFVYRLLLIYLFYFISRLLFVYFNNNILEVKSFTELMELSYKGLIFDTAALFYVNGLFVVLSLIPLFFNTTKWYQKLLFYIYFIFNLSANAINFVDFIYYRFTLERSTIASLDSISNEDNQLSMLVRFLITYWYVFLLYILISITWVYLYKRVRVRSIVIQSKLIYFISSVIVLLAFTTLAIAGIRGGDLKKSTRPITLVDANNYVSNIKHADIVLNTPFTMVRTIGNKAFSKVSYTIDSSEIKKRLEPRKQYKPIFEQKYHPNIVLIIVESLSREYISFCNKNITDSNYKGFTPFIDSLCTNSLVYTNSFANGSKSIHAMGSVLAGIPSFKQPFTTSKYVQQRIQSAVSIGKQMGYTTSFFHGAPNGSMGFLGFSNILGFDKYYGLTEYDNYQDFDGSWGIWDEEFLQYMKTVFDTQQQPFLSTVFTLSSHEPFKIPERYIGKFPKGNVQMNRSIGYADYALRKFFESAKKEPWFDNTIFIITGDHGNQVYYDTYKKVMNRNVVPIIIYKPDNSLAKIDTSLAQQMDIYPTIVNLMGYEQEFRSWGRSLVQSISKEPYVVNGIGQIQFQQGKYICTFSGEKITGLYTIKDRELKNNILSTETNEHTKNIINNCKAFVKDYFDKIVDKKLD